MSFESILEGIVHEGIGILGAALMENDGIVIEQVHAVRRGQEPLQGDIGVAGVEFGHIVGDIAKATDSLGGGAVNETVVSASRFTLIFHSVEEGVLLAVVMAPDGNLGKARYLIRRSLPAIKHEL
jgi:predicted regulator of Ras-like GTPase activity (Roadblock/LC7/MglB family)